MTKIVSPIEFLKMTATSSKSAEVAPEKKNEVEFVTPELPKKATRKEIAEHFGVSLSTVSRRLKKAGYNVGRGGKIDTTTKKFGKAFEGLEEPQPVPMVQVDLPEQATLSELTGVFKASYRRIKKRFAERGMLKGKGELYTKEEYQEALEGIEVRKRVATQEEVERHNVQQAEAKKTTYISYKDVLSVFGFQKGQELYNHNKPLFMELFHGGGPYDNNMLIARLEDVLKIVPEQYHAALIQKGE